MNMLLLYMIMDFILYLIMITRPVNHNRQGQGQVSDKIEHVIEHVMRNNLDCFWV